MNRLLTSFAVMLGSQPRKPTADELTPAARELHARKTAPGAALARKALILEEKKSHPKARQRWRIWRWTSIIAVNLLFVLSFQADVQVVEGALTASRFVGFHMADLNSALQVMLASKELVINLVIGTSTVLFLWWLLGGRTFCSWVCPYHLLAEIAEMIHLRLAKRGLVKDHPLDRRTRTAVYLVFAGLAIVTGYTVFETINPVGILSRAFTYGAGLAVIWVAALLVVEIVYSRRFWCRYMCPIGLTYGVVGAFSPVIVRYEAETCLHEGECRKVCMVPHVLSMTRLGWNHDTRQEIGADCTRCGMCVDACPTGALKFDIKGLAKLI